jgi:hypothetical protein
MKIVILFALFFSLSSAFALTKIPPCNDILKIRVDLNAGPGFAPYTPVFKDLSWAQNLGRPLKVEYETEDHILLAVEQTAYNWTQFSQRYPQFVKYGKQVLAVHNAKMRELSTRIARLRLAMTRSHDERRKLPGETGTMAAFVGSGEYSLPVMNEAGIQITLPAQDLFEKMPRALPVPHIDILIFHTHPAGVLPLSPEDKEMMIGTASDFQRQYPGASVRVVMVAAAKIRTQGDLIFVTEFRRGP